jgi:hypothetical protein
MPVNVYVQMPSCVPERARGSRRRRRRSARRRRRGDDLAQHHRPRRDDEFPRRRRQRRARCWPRSPPRSAPARRSAATTPRPISAAPSTATSPAARPTTTRARAPKTPSPACARACARCCGWARPGTTSRRRSRRSPSGLDSRNFILCTDDSHSGTLVNDGHMDRVVRHAIAQGLKPITAIQMATLNTAQHFGLEREIGSITPGRRADFLIVTGPRRDCRSTRSIARGVVLAETAFSSSRSRPTTIRQGQEHGQGRPRLAARDFDVAAPAGATRCARASSASSRTRRRRGRSSAISPSRTGWSPWTAQ